MPDIVRHTYASPGFAAAEDRGLLIVRDSAFVLVAGGLGERLGYTDIKVSLPVQSVTEQCYMDLYVAQILAMQAKSNEAAGGTPSIVPLAIMTSGDTHDKTAALLSLHNDFGAAPGQITLMKQEKVAALTDNEAHFAMDDAYTIETKPHGHGDVHTLLASTGLAKKWMAEGKKYIVFFQDTNSLCFTVTIAALGVSAEKGYEVNSIAVPRKAKDAVGAITKLVRPDGSSMTVNVEYNQLEPMLLASGFPEGDSNGPDGFSLFPGNINQLIFAIPPYVAVLERTGGLVPEFVNPKYADASKTTFKKPTRLECMMQEHPKVLGPEAVVGATMFDDWTYSPVKNSHAEAAQKVASGNPGRSALEGEFEYYESASHALKAIGVSLPPPGRFTAMGMTVRDVPRIVFANGFINTFSDVARKFPQPSAIKVTNSSALVLRGAGIVVESLDLDGALDVVAVPGAHVTIKGLTVRNAGLEFVPLTQETAEKVAEWKKIRCFTVEKKQVRTVVYDKPGNYVLSE